MRSVSNRWAAACATVLMLACTPTPNATESTTATDEKASGQAGTRLKPPASGALTPLVVITSFEDFQCPFCQRVAGIRKAVLARFKDSVQWQYRNLPLPFHALAKGAARAALAAFKQGHFEEMSTILYRALDTWTQSSFQTQVTSVEEVGIELRLLPTERSAPVDLKPGAQGHFKDGTQRVEVSRKNREGHVTVFLPLATTQLPAAIEAGRPVTVIFGRKAYQIPRCPRGRRCFQSAGRVLLAPPTKQTICTGESTNAQPACLGKPADRGTIGPWIDVTAWQATEKGTLAWARTKPRYRGLDRLKRLLQTGSSVTIKRRRPQDNGEFRRLLLKLAEPLGLDMQQFTQDLGVPKEHDGAVAMGAKDITSRLQRDMTLAKLVGARGTPTLVVNGKVATARDLNSITQAVTQQLAQAHLAITGRKDANGKCYDGKLPTHGACRVLKRAEVAYELTALNRTREIADALIKDRFNTPLLGGATQPKPKPSPTGTSRTPVNIPTQGSPSLGPADAKITLIEFSDFQCPHCGRIGKPLKALVAKYPKDVRVVFKNFPLGFHKHARKAAEAALAAHAQGKFWPMHDLLFENMRALEPDRLEGYALGAGLDVALFKEALNAGTFTQKVDRDLADGRRAGVRGTPSLFINGVPYKGPRTLAGFEAEMARYHGLKLSP